MIVREHDSSSTSTKTLIPARILPIMGRPEWPGPAFASLRVHCKTSRQVVEADERTAEMEEGFVDVRTPLVAHRKPPIAGETCQRALHHPSVATELLAGIHPSPGDAPLDVALSERLPAPGKS